MKRYLLLFLVCLMAFGLQAQNDWKGPKAKNRKLWKDPKASTKLYVKTGKSLKGPQAKNARPLERKEGDMVEVFFTKREILKGPAAKNKKLWRN